MGFDTTRFQVDLHGKISFPFVCLIMTLLGIPFAFSMGRKGTLVGIGLSVVIAMVYWGAIGVFRSLGYVDLPGAVPGGLDAEPRLRPGGDLPPFPPKDLRPRRRAEARGYNNGSGYSPRACEARRRRRHARGRPDRKRGPSCSALGEELTR